MGFFPIQILIFLMLRNNANARRCSYFELGLPVCTWANRLVHGLDKYAQNSGLVNSNQFPSTKEDRP